MDYTTPPSPTMSISMTTSHGPSAETRDIKELLADMRETLGSLGVTFETLGEHTSRVAALAPLLETQDQLKSLRRHMRAQDQRYNESMEDVQRLLTNVLRDELADHLRERVETMIDEVFAEEVEQQVALAMEEYLPTTLQEQLVECEAQLHEVQRSLRNSEARRANGLLRYNNMHDPLHPLYNSQGVVSPTFPKNLAEIFGMTNAQAKVLGADYNIPDLTDSREKNLNKLMSYIGVMYQMVPTAK